MIQRFARSQEVGSKETSFQYPFKAFGGQQNTSLSIDVFVDANIDPARFFPSLADFQVVANGVPKTLNVISAIVVPQAFFRIGVVPPAMLPPISVTYVRTTSQIISVDGRQLKDFALTGLGP